VSATIKALTCAGCGSQIACEIREAEGVGGIAGRVTFVRPTVLAGLALVPVEVKGAMQSVVIAACATCLPKVAP
jgi:hypothetical protein